MHHVGAWGDYSEHSLFYSITCIIFLYLIRSC